MGVGVVFAGMVVAVVGVLGGYLFDPCHDVLPEAGLVVVDDDGGGDVHGRDERQAFLDAAFVDDALDLVSDRYDFFAFFGVEGEIGGMSLCCCQ